MPKSNLSPPDARDIGDLVGRHERWTDRKARTLPPLDFGGREPTVDDYKAEAIHSHEMMLVAYDKRRRNAWQRRIPGTRPD